MKSKLFNSTIKKSIVTTVVCLVCFSQVLFAQNSKNAYSSVYHYEVSVGTRTAYLWIPPSCKYVRAVIFAAENALERNWMESPIIRKAATEENLAMIWLADGKNSIINYEIKPEAALLLDTMFFDLAKISGYDELKFTPIIFTGHSWNGRMAWNYPAQKSGRTLAAVAIRTYPMPDTLLFKNIPFLYIVGQTTELPQYNDGRLSNRDFFWPVVQQTALALRAKDENNLIGVAVNPGGCHMDWTDEQSKLLALFIHKACKYRLQNNYPANGKVILKKILPSSGYLTDAGLMEADKYPPASYHQYKGNTKKSFWFFDKELADAVIAFNGDRKIKQKQMPTFVQDNDTLSVQKNGYVHLKWLPEKDGLSFKLHTTFLKKIPAGLIDSMNEINHAEQAIKLYHVMGPAVQINDTVFKLQFDRQKPRNIMIMADAAGNNIFRRAAQPASLNIQAVLNEGAEQKIIFPSIKNQKAGIKYLQLQATSSSGLPVQYYIKSGPAVIDGDKIIFTPVPVKSKYPVKITVTVWQYGTVTEPKIKSAEPVTQSFYLIKEQAMKKNKKYDANN
ncbi:MAG TPA: hypothetical protein VHP12_03405 [Chitinophagaceae bacterium]|nr:hypothetical protein [Chitinophagaceae bacterium]